MAAVGYFLKLDNIPGESQDAKHKGEIEVLDFSFDIEQVLNIGSQSTGAGAGKVTFNPFTITKRIDKATPLLYNNRCSGTPSMVAAFVARKAGKEQEYLKVDFKLVAVKTMAWIDVPNGLPIEKVSFEFGSMKINYSEQKADGTLSGAVSKGWDRVRNVAW